MTPHEMMMRPPSAPHEYFMRPAAATTPRAMMRPCAPHEFFTRRPAAAAATPRAMTPEPEEELQLSDFEKVADLGEGIHGAVTKVRLRGSDSDAMFALKVSFYPDDDVDRQKEVLRRAEGSPHVVRCHAVLRGGGGGEPAYLLELMDAGSLHDVLSRRGGRGLPEPVLAEVAARCLAGLVHLHSRGVAHLDLKPDNLLASTRGDVKISDFSLSRIFSTRAGKQFPITLASNGPAPERYEPHAHDGQHGVCAADVLDLGFTVWELFFGMGECPALPCDEQSPVPESAAMSAELHGFVAACVRKEPRMRATVVQLLAHPFVARRDVEASRRALRETVVDGM